MPVPWGRLAERLFFATQKMPENHGKAAGLLETPGQNYKEEKSRVAAVNWADLLRSCLSPAPECQKT